jgi:uncharacterized protein (DUF885 family)
MRVLSVPITTLLLAAALSAQQRGVANIEDFFRDFTAEWVRFNPNQATASRFFTGDEQDRLERQLTPLTLEWRRTRIQLAKRGLVELRKFDRSGLTETQRISAEVMQWQLETVVREEPFLDYTFPLEQFNGANVSLPYMLTVVHPVLNEKDADNYIAALGQVATRMNEALAEAQRLAGEGILPPRFILQATIKQMQSFTDSMPSQNPFVAVFAQKMAAVKSIPEAKREQLRSEAEKVVSAQVYAAWRKAIALLESQVAQATDAAGLWRLRRGAEAYAYDLRRFTTTTLTPEQIHEIGLKQVDRIEAEMDKVLRQLGRTEGSVKDRIAKLEHDLQYPDPASEASRERIMQDINGILRDAEKRAELLFDKRPRAPVIAQPFPRFSEANAAANYTPPPADGSRPGVFQYPRRLDKMTRFALRSTVYHETVPGHHFQIALELEDPNLPRFRQIRALGGISAFTEGWGLYAEHLAAESGWYKDDLEGLLGELDSELFRARRLVVDTGIHAKHWTRQQAIDYGIEPSEVERYVVYPGQACSYMLGELKIIELREKARTALGGRFSLQKFHNFVFETGSVPLDILERQLDAYIRSTAN